MEILQYDFMQRALLAALLVGLTAPVVGVYLVQRRLALIGDGLGHVALTGVALGVLTGRAPVLVALACSVAGCVVAHAARLAGASNNIVNPISRIFMVRLLARCLVQPVFHLWCRGDRRRERRDAAWTACIAVAFGPDVRNLSWGATAARRRCAELAQAAPLCGPQEPENGN